MPRLYGFDDPSRRRLRDGEVGAIRQAVSRALVAGESNAEIAQWMNGEGYRGTLGSSWTSMTVGRLFKNPAIAGLMRDDSGRLVAAGHPSIITVEEFSALQERDKKRKTADRVPAYAYFLSAGLARCGNCGQELTGARNNTGTAGYRCRPSEKDGRGGCGTVRIQAELLETYVAEYVLAELLKPEVGERIVQAIDAANGQVAKLKNDINVMEARRADLAGPYARGEIRRDAFVAADQEISMQVKALRDRLRYAEQLTSVSFGGVHDLVKWWDTAPAASKRALVMIFLEKLEVFAASSRGVRTIEPGRVKLHWRSGGSGPGASSS